MVNPYRLQRINANTINNVNENMLTPYAQFSI